MGIGDEIMITGEVKRRAAGTARRFAIWDTRKAGLHRWHDMWAGNPRIAMPGQPYEDRLINHGGMRPYIAEKLMRSWKWQAYTPEPGEIFLTPHELQYARQTQGAVLVQPTIKLGASPNKQWPLERWQQLVEGMPTVPWLQVGTGGEPRLKGVRFLETRTFREACGALAGARAAVLHEGGLHHAAAAFGTKAVVIFGGYISPACTGYTIHRNVFTEHKGHPLGCGMRTQCLHCEMAMKSINHRAVSRNLEEILV